MRSLSHISVCLFIGVLGRGDYLGHYAPITHLTRLLWGVYYYKFYVHDVREKIVCSDPDRLVPKDMSKSNV